MASSTFVVMPNGKILFLTKVVVFAFKSRSYKFYHSVKSKNVQSCLEYYCDYGGRLLAE